MMDDCGYRGESDILRYSFMEEAIADEVWLFYQLGLDCWWEGQSTSHLIPKISTIRKINDYVILF